VGKEKYENEATMNGEKKKQVKQEINRRIIHKKQVGTRNVEFRN
jgi:hypothetical protein